MAAKLDKSALDLTLLANFLHQIINPLNGVCGTIDNITQGEVPSGAVPQRLRAARAQIEHCVALIRNLAFFSEFSRNPEEYRERHKGKVCVLPQVVIEAMMFFQESARKKHMKIHLLDRETQYKVSADPDLIRQVFMNIFDNCVKYGNTYSDITMKAHIQKKSNDLIVEIMGASVPVPVENREKIFELGFRGENARQIVASGTGLGLYICRLIVQIYGGNITYMGRGETESIFTIRLPGGWV